MSILWVLVGWLSESLKAISYQLNKANPVVRQGTD
jgi:hypothetical protein